MDKHFYLFGPNGGTPDMEVRKVHILLDTHRNPEKASNLVPKYLTHKSQSYPCNQFSPLVTPTTSTINKVYLSTYLPHSVILVKARNSPLWMYQHRPLGTACFFFHLLHIFFPKPAFSSGGDDAYYMCLLHAASKFLREIDRKRVILGQGCYSGVCPLHRSSSGIKGIKEVV